MPKKGRHARAVAHSTTFCAVGVLGLYILNMTSFSTVWLIVIYTVCLNHFAFYYALSLLEELGNVLFDPQPYLSLLPEICRRNVPNPFAARSDINEISFQNDTSRDDANFSDIYKV